MKLCKDCKWYRNMGPYKVCTRPVPSKVTGTKPIDMECHKYRANMAEWCGPDARFFQPSLLQRFKRLFT